MFAVGIHQTVIENLQNVNYFTFHEHVHGVSQDSDRGDEDEDREDERTNGIDDDLMKQSRN